MFWIEKIIEKIEDRFSEEIQSGKPLIIRDEKTASGRVHVGSMRGVGIHGAVSQELTNKGIANTFLYEINDFDTMDGIPAYLDATVYEQYMGVPLCNIPAPDGKAKNYAEYFAEEFIEVIEETGFHPEYYRSSDVYKSGKYNEVIRLTLEHADKIREIYKEVSGSIKPDDWMPLQVTCEQCGKNGTTKTIAFDGERVRYVCLPDMVSWAQGCGHEGVVSPFDGNAKLPWKVEWAAKFRVLSVDIEGGGKDHSTRGGARDVANHIAQEVFQYTSPIDIPYEFFLVGGKKMSSSKGAGSTSRDIASLLPPKLFRFLLISRDIKKVIDFEPEGDTIPLLYDLYDKYAEHFWQSETDDYSHAFALANQGEFNKDEPLFLPRFSQVSFIAQMKHLHFLDEMKSLKGSELNSKEEQEALLRKEYALKWLSAYAPEKYRFELQETVPKEVSNFSVEQKQALRMLQEYFENTENKTDGQSVHSALHHIKETTQIEPKPFFSALYTSFLGKESGPKAGWFLSVLPREFVISRLEAVTK